MRAIVVTGMLAGAVVLGTAGTSAAAVNCSNFSSQLAAQNYYNAQTGDPDELDADHDGWACESLPAPKAAARKGSSPVAPTPLVTAPVISCNVPNVKRLTRAKAIRALEAAGCEAGRITKPKKKRRGRTLKVKSQSKAPGVVLEQYAEVSFRLGY